MPATVLTVLAKLVLHPALLLKHSDFKELQYECSLIPFTKLHASTHNYTPRYIYYITFQQQPTHCIVHSAEH